MEENKKYIDHLDEDEIIPSQMYACMSFLSPDNIDPSVLKNKDTTMRGLKIRGVFPTLEDAKEFTVKLREKDPYFNIFIGPVGKWLPWDDTNKAEEENYKEKELNDLMYSYKKNQELSKKEMEKRKEEAKMSASNAKKSKSKKSSE
jgi:hypothetical protein